jgi:uncharacterized protein
VEFASEKWGGIPHYRGEMRRLGHDEHGAWWWGDAGRTIFRGDEALFTTNEDVLICVPDGAWWSAAWWVGHPEVSLYVNINTPVVYEPDRFVVVDLDLDVVRLVDGTASIVDQDEFAEHQVRYGYPPDVIAETLRVTDDVLAAVEAGQAPFTGGVAESWIERARSGPTPSS